jgi:alginate O-acetyltransferase complex protein AlgI
LFLLRLYRRLGALSIVPTFAITIMGWVLFRAENMSSAIAYLRVMLGAGTAAELPYFSREFWFTLVLAAFICFAATVPRAERWEIGVLAKTQFTLSQAAVLVLSLSSLLLLSMSYIVGSSFNPFIYFRF